MFRKSLCLLAAVPLPILLDQPYQPDTKRHAICILYPNGSDVRGTASFSQDSITSPTKIVCSVRGLNPNAKHGIHIHEFGDLSEGYQATGSHYNPFNKNHGSPFYDERHAGDLGNLMADPFGNAYLCFTDKLTTLYGDNSILGRAVVVHAKEDDLGRTNDSESLKTGNSGGGVACGIIGLSKQFKTVPPSSQ